MTIETIDPFASRDIAGISRWRRLFVVGAFCADIAASSNGTAAMYLNMRASPCGRKLAFSLH
jgi:hypothetical protein